MRKKTLRTIVSILAAVAVLSATAIPVSAEDEINTDSTDLMAALGIISGYDDSTFNSMKLITSEQMGKIVATTSYSADGSQFTVDLSRIQTYIYEVPKGKYDSAYAPIQYGSITCCPVVEGNGNTVGIAQISDITPVTESPYAPRQYGITDFVGFSSGNTETTADDGVTQNSDLGILVKMGDGTFAPDSNVSYNQAAATLLKALGYDTSTEQQNNNDGKANRRDSFIADGLKSNVYNKTTTPVFSGVSASPVIVDTGNIEVSVVVSGPAASANVTLGSTVTGNLSGGIANAPVFSVVSESPVVAGTGNIIPTPVSGVVPGPASPGIKPVTFSASDLSDGVAYNWTYSTGAISGSATSPVIPGRSEAISLIPVQYGGSAVVTSGSDNPKVTYNGTATPYIIGDTGSGLTRTYPTDITKIN